MGMNKAYASSAAIFDQVSKRFSPNLYEQLRSVKKGEIAVVQGEHDHIEKLMDVLKVPYALVESIDNVFDDENSKARVMLVNCKSYDEESVSRKKVQDFVEQGGRLVTTDWALSVVTKSFPGKMRKMTNETEDDVVEVYSGSDLGARLMGLRYAQCHPQWWLECSSHVFDIKDKENVIPVILSDEMKEKYGKPYIAAGFAQGRGEVVHFISHLELQRTKAKGKHSDKGLEDFLKKMGATKTSSMDSAVKLAELEAAYSSLNTLAYLCAAEPLFSVSGKSIVLKASKGAKFSVDLSSGLSGGK